MPILSTPPVVPRRFQFSRGSTAPGSATGRRRLLDVQTIGYRVPRTDFSGHVHSVFAQSCNWACDDTLLTLSTARAGNGPTTLRLNPGAPGDLRVLFNPGERVDGRQGRVQTVGNEISLMHAGVWQPAEVDHFVPPALAAANLCRAGESLARRRCTHSSIIGREAVPIVTALQGACLALDIAQATQQVDTLIGWGEGLTPAGDDFLVGLMAGLDALPQQDEQRRRFRDALAAHLRVPPHRTTPIAVHYLQLAASGHYSEPLLSLRNALIGAEHADKLDAALQAALTIGATSGADTVSGLLAGLAAWMPRPPIALVA